MALFIAVQTFLTERRGRSELISAGEIAGSKSWPVGLHPDAFRPLEIRWPDEPDAKSSDSKSSDDESVSASTTGAQKPASPATLKHRGGGRPGGKASSEI